MKKHFSVPLPKIRGRKFRLAQNENGYTLMEMVVVIILLGIVMPSVFSLLASISVHSIRNSVKDQVISHSAAKLEEIIGQKEAQWNWYTNPTQFEVDENLAGGYHRTVTVTAISNWGNAALDAWEIRVAVDHPQLPDGYSLTVRFTRYTE